MTFHPDAAPDRRAESRRIPSVGGLLGHPCLAGLFSRVDRALALETARMVRDRTVLDLRAISREQELNLVAALSAALR